MILFKCFIVFATYDIIIFLNEIELPYKMGSINFVLSEYAIGTYNIKGLKIGRISPDAEVEVFRQQPISRVKPTAFIAGSAYEKKVGSHPVDQVIYKAQDLGAVLGEIYTVITGHCPGVPSYVARAALKKSNVIGISPFGNSAQHVGNWKASKIYRETEFKLEPQYSASIAIHVGSGTWHRDVCNIELTNNHRQHVYVVGGNTGTFHETIVAVAHGAVVGALLGVGGVSDDIRGNRILL